VTCESERGIYSNFFFYPNVKKNSMSDLWILFTKILQNSEFFFGLIPPDGTAGMANLIFFLVFFLCVFCYMANLNYFFRFLSVCFVILFAKSCFREVLNTWPSKPFVSAIPLHLNCTHDILSFRLLYVI